MTNILLVIAVIAVIGLTVVLFSQQAKVKKALAEVEFQKQSISEKENLLLKEARIKAKEELQSDREKLNEEEAAFAEKLVAAVRTHKEELLSELGARVMRFAEYRIYPADKAVLLLAMAEIRFFDDIPPVVSVSEATALARKYSTEKSTDFVNGVLGGIINS